LTITNDWSTAADLIYKDIHDAPTLSFKDWQDLYVIYKKHVLVDTFGSPIYPLSVDDIQPVVAEAERLILIRRSEKSGPRQGELF
jgi:hypothetical protein